MSNESKGANKIDFDIAWLVQSGQGETIIC